MNINNPWKGNWHQIYLNFIMAKGSDVPVTSLPIIQKAGEEEEKGKIEDAITLYETAIKEKKVDEYPFDRLMIIYRKLKKYKDELRVINKGIRVFEDFYKRQSAKPGAGKKKLADLSNAFMKTARLNDKKGRPLYQPEPIARWLKRKAVVEKKLK